MRCFMFSDDGISSFSLAAILWKAMLTISDKGAEKVHEFLASQQADVSLAGLRGP